MHARTRLLPIVIAAVSAGLLAAPAAARPVAPKPTLIDQRGKRVSGAPARWMRQSRMPLFSGRVMLVRRPCPAQPTYSGCVYSRHPRRLYISPRARNPRAVVYHELGHSFDLLRFHTRHRRAFKRTMGLRGRGWFSGRVSASELFAEGYALCSRFGVHRPSVSRLGYTKSVYGYRPSRRQHRAVCRLIERVGTAGRRTPVARPPAGAPPVAEQVAPPTATAPAPGDKPQPEPQPNPLLPGLPLPLPLN